MVPGPWNPIIDKPEDPELRDLGPTGFATYILRLKGLKPHKDADLALEFQRIFSAYSCYLLPVRDLDLKAPERKKIKPLFKSGVLGKSENDEIPHGNVILKKIDLGSENIVILLHVSNNHTIGNIRKYMVFLSCWISPLCYRISDEFRIETQRCSIAPAFGETL